MLAHKNARGPTRTILVHDGTVVFCNRQNLGSGSVEELGAPVTDVTETLQHDCLALKTGGQT